MSTLKWMAAVACLVACSGCSVISGTVTDADSGEPLPEVQVGVLVLLPGTFAAVFEERARTDSEGHYQIAYGFSQPTFSFRLEDYLNFTLADPSDPSALDVALQSIAPIKGAWNATITVEGAEIPATRFEFDEGGMAWRAGDAFLGEVEYAFDGDTVVVDGELGAGDVFFGDLNTSLVLNDAGDSLSGTIAFTHDFFTEAVCRRVHWNRGGGAGYPIGAGAALSSQYTKRAPEPVGSGAR